MKTFDELCLNMQYISASLYRFQGYQSVNYVNPYDFSFLNYLERYVYFSANEQHHYTYIRKKLYNYFWKIAKKELHVSLQKKDLLSLQNYHDIMDLLEKENQTFTSIQIYFCKEFMQLIELYAISNKIKRTGSLQVEKVDPHNYSCGYGFTHEWLNLLYKMSLLYVFYNFTKNDILETFQILRKNIIGCTPKMNYVYYLADAQKYYQMNPFLNNPFLKYEIMNLLEILEKNGYIVDAIKHYKILIDGKEQLQNDMQKILDNICERKLEKKERRIL